MIGFDPCIFPKRRLGIEYRDLLFYGEGWDGCISLKIIL